MITQEMLDTIKPGTVWTPKCGTRPEVYVVLITRQHLKSLEARTQANVIIRTESGALLSLSPSLLFRHYQYMGFKKADKKMDYIVRLLDMLEEFGISDFCLTYESLVNGTMVVNGQNASVEEYSKVLTLVRTFISAKTRISKVNQISLHLGESGYQLHVVSETRHDAPYAYQSTTEHTFHLGAKDEQE